MKVHKYAEYFPLLEGEEFDLLVKDIKENGQLIPIVMIGDEVLDGVNRHRVCDELGIKPRTEEYKNGDALSYVISTNIRRRHLDVSQRAMLATEMLPIFEEKYKKSKAEKVSHYRKTGEVENGKAQPRQASDAVAKEFGISGMSVRRAKRIKKEVSSDRIKNIIKGKENINAVDEELKKQKQLRDKEIFEGQHQKDPSILEARINTDNYIDQLKEALALIRRRPEIVTDDGLKRFQAYWLKIKNLIEEYANETSRITDTTGA